MQQSIYMRLLRKRSMNLHGVGLGVSHSFRTPQRLGDKGAEYEFFSTFLHNKDLYLENAG